MKSSSSSMRASEVLSIRAADPTTEVFVADGRFRRVASGVGHVEVDVPPGVYKVRYRSGSTQHDELVEVPAGQGVVHVHGRPVEYSSSIPLEGTSTSRERHAEPAHDLSLRFHAHPGQGSALFLFARDLSDDPERGFHAVTIHDVDGEQVAALTDGEGDDGAGFCGINLEVDPGTYRVRIETGPLGTYEMFVVASPDWQSQAFFLTDAFTAMGTTLRRPALRSASVLMSRPGMGFHGSFDNLRLADLARIGLQTGRIVIRGEELNDLLRGKFDNPMLGIYGAHLLLQRPRTDHRLVDVVAGNLRDLLGAHPDVEALELRHRTPPEDASFPTPPMLRSSWNLIVRASRRRHSLVPPGSVTGAVADELLESEPWLLHQVHEDRAERSDPEISFAEARRQYERLRESAGADEAMLAAAEDPTDVGGETLTSLEQNLLASAIDEPEDRPSRSRELFKEVLARLTAPSSSIARSIGSLSAKLDKFRSKGD